MIKFEEELKNILENDPLGLLEVRPKQSGLVTSDDRLLASFEEINEFIRKNGKEPTKTNEIRERKLFSRLQSLRENPEKATILKEYDTFNLLTGIKTLGEIRQEKEINTIDDVLNEDSLGLLDKEDSTHDIFTYRNIPKKQTMPESIAKRKPCRNFKKYEPLFLKAHSDLKAKIATTEPFSSERQITPGSYFILSGMIVYVASIGEWEKKNFGNVNAKTHCIFENGTESKMLLRSLAAALWKDKTSRHIIDALQSDMFVDKSAVNTEDKSAGYIYVVKSLSDDLAIKGHDHLFKIGFTYEPNLRFENAKNDPTFLMADVKIVAQYQVYNMNTEKLELLLHRFFSSVCLNIDVFDRAGRRYAPREWFAVPFEIIDEAIRYFINGEIVHFKYDADARSIIRK